MARDATTPGLPWTGALPALQLRGGSNLEQLGGLLPDPALRGQPFDPSGPAEWAAAGYPISAGDALDLELHYALLELGRSWQGAAIVDTYCESNASARFKDQCTIVFPPTVRGFTAFAGAYLSAMAELLGLEKLAPLPVYAQQAILTMVGHRLIDSEYLQSLEQPGGPSAQLVDAGILGPNATVAVTDESGIVTEVIYGTNLEVGDFVDLEALDTSVDSPGSEGLEPGAQLERLELSPVAIGLAAAVAFFLLRRK